MLSEMQKRVHGGWLESGFSYGDFLMHLPSADTSPPAYGPNGGPAQPEPWRTQRHARVVITNGPLPQHRVEPVYTVGRFEVSRVPDFTVRQAAPAAEHGAGVLPS